MIVVPIRLSDEEHELLARPIHPRVARLLKDLTVDGLGSKVPAVVGGARASQPASSQPGSSSWIRPPGGGPIV